MVWVCETQAKRTVEELWKPIILNVFGRIFLIISERKNKIDAGVHRCFHVECFDCTATNNSKRLRCNLSYKSIVNWISLTWCGGQAKGYAERYDKSLELREVRQLVGMIRVISERWWNLTVQFQDMGAAWSHRTVNVRVRARRSLECTPAGRWEAGR